MGNKNFIEINGKKYDAITGKLLSEQQKPAEKPKAAVQPVKNTGVVDGFKKRPAKPSKTRQQAKHAAKSNQQKSKTLVRNAVQKPAPTVAKVKKKLAPTIEKSHLGVSARRQEQAKKVAKSHKVSKYSEQAVRTSIVKKHAPVSVKPAPSSVTAPAKKAVKTMSEVAASTATKIHSRSVDAEKLIEAALSNAKSHEEKPVRHKSRRRSKFARKLGISSKTAAFSSGALAVVLLAGFFALQNVPNLAMRVAATRAGFNASMPGYSPSGFSFRGPINYSSGQVTISFRSNVDNRFYDVKQTSSNWNSDALLANFVIADNKQYQTYLDKGRTLYIYDGSNATWVDNGVWYQVEGESEMTTDQLIRIASSI